MFIFVFPYFSHNIFRLSKGHVGYTYTVTKSQGRQGRQFNELKIDINEVKIKCEMCIRDRVS